MHFLLFSLSVVYVLTTPISEDGENATMEQIRKRNKWDNDDYVCKGLILNGHGNAVSSLMDTAYRYNDNKGKRKHHDTKADPNKKSKVTCWKCRKPGHLKNGLQRMMMMRGGLTQEQLCIPGALIYFVEDDVAWWVTSGATMHVCKDRCFMSTAKLNDSILWHARLGHVHFKRMQDISKDRIIPYELWTKREPNMNYLKIWGYRTVVRLPDPKLKNLVSIKSIIESNDAIFDENRFSSVSRPSQRYLINGIKDIGALVVPKEKDAINDEMDSIMSNNTWVFADLPLGCKPLGCKWIFKRKYKVDGTIEKFKARLVIQGFRQKSGIDYFDTYAPMAHISVIRLMIAMALIHNLIIHQMDVKIAFLNGELDEEFDDVVLSNGYLLNQADKCGPDKGIFVIKVLYEIHAGADVILGIRIKHKSNGIAIYQSHYIEKAVSQLEYSRMIDCLMYVITCTRPEISFIVGKLSSNTEDNLSTSGWVLLLSGGAISWASKKQTCITSSIMKYEFMALAAIGKEAEWLRNLIFEISL
nr:hypothetical protein [Tanacetum cinerariifolium]